MSRERLADVAGDLDVLRARRPRTCARGLRPSSDLRVGLACVFPGVDRDAEEPEARRPRARESAGRSPTPPVNTSTSSPPSAAAIAAMPAAGGGGRRRSRAASASPVLRARGSAACRRCRQPEQARAVLERRRELRRRHPRVLLEPEQEPGVERARAGRHHEPVERREAHRRVDRHAARDRGERGAGAEMAGDDPQRPRPAGRQLARRGAARRRGTARGSRSGAGPSARATPRAARRSRRPRACGRGTRCRSTRPPARSGSSSR